KATSTNNVCDQDEEYVTNKWLVTRIADTHSNAVTIAYTTETSNSAYDCQWWNEDAHGGTGGWSTKTITRTYTSAARPAQVSYAGGNALVNFGYEQKPSAFACTQDNQNSQESCEYYRLNQVQ